MFPDADTPNRLFNGVPFKDLHTFNIRVSPNNTIISLTDNKGNEVTFIFCLFLIVCFRRSKAN